jgi:4-hydroxymandelate oxidase
MLEDNMEQKMQKDYKAGDSNQITRDYLDSLLIELRYIDAVIPSMTLEIYGEIFSTPIMTAALSHLDRYKPGGMIEMARGALAAGAVMWAGMGDEAELEAITATGAKTIIVIKPYADNDLILKKIEHARRCGVLAIGMDIDHAFNQKGQFGSVLGYPMASKTQAEIESFVQAARIPFIVKGVLSEQDTDKCMTAGVQGIVISHHHGIQDYAIPPLMALPRIARMVDRSMPIFVDCCITSGFDAFKALALGATAVSVGRGLISSLSEEGAAGIQKKIESMTHEMMAAMARTCSPDLLHIDASVIWKR